MTPHAHHEQGTHGYGHSHDHSGGYNPASLQRSDAFYRPTYGQIVAWLNVAPGGRVLDAGSGTGLFTELLASAVGPDGSVTALDLSETLLDTVRERLAGSPLARRVTFQVGDLSNLPWDAPEFDLVWTSRTIHHLPDQVAGLQALRRVLKPRCRLALREGGLPARFLPPDVGLGRPGLQDRLHAYFQEWFSSQVRAGMVRHPHGWTQTLRDAGFSHVTARSFLVEALPPFDEVQTAYMHEQLARWVGHAQPPVGLAPDDAETLAQLVDPESQHYAFRRPDLHYLEAVTVYVGVA